MQLHWLIMGVAGSKLWLLTVQTKKLTTCNKNFSALRDKGTQKVKGTRGTFLGIKLSKQEISLLVKGKFDKTNKQTNKKH